MLFHLLYVASTLVVVTSDASATTISATAVVTTIATATVITIIIIRVFHLTYCFC